MIYSFKNKQSYSNWDCLDVKLNTNKIFDSCNLSAESFFDELVQ